MCSLSHHPALFLPSMVNSESPIVCGSRHFTHGYIKPVGGRSWATYHVCVSMHDFLMKYWRALLWTIGWLAITVPSFYFPPPAFISLPWRRLSQHSVQIRKANLIWSHDRANPSQLQNEKAAWSESIPRTSMGSFSQMPCPLQPGQCSNMMKRDPGEFGSLALFMRKEIMKNRGAALKMERCSDRSVCLCVMCMTAPCTFICPSPWWKLDLFGLGFLTHPSMIHVQFYWLKPLCWQRKAELSIDTATTKFFSTINSVCNI